MRHWVAAALLSWASLPVGCTAEADRDAVWPEIVVEDLATGAPLSSTALMGMADGRPSVVTVWAVWCEPCRKELPALDGVARRRSDSLTVVGLNHGDEPARAREFLDELDVAFPSLRDPDGRLVTALGVGSLPATFVVDASGAIVWRRLGVVTPGEVEAAVQDVLDAVPQPSSKRPIEG